jgi:hypothetical protein
VNRQVSGGSNTVNITLSAGNVTGRVTKSANTGVAGAFVTATLMGTNTKLTTTTQDDGSYGFDLDFSGGKVWSIQASPPKADKNLSANTLTVSSATTNANIALS